MKAMLPADEDTDPRTRRAYQILDVELQRSHDALTLEWADVGLDEVARRCVDAIVPLAASRDIDVDLAATRVRLRGDAGRLAQVIDNLLSNAVQFTAPGGRVRVRVRAEGDRAVIEVDDNGIGVPIADLPGLFERIARAAEATRGATPGTGGGLAAVKRLTEMHGGVVSVESAEGAGARFRVEIPLGTGGRE